MVLEPCDLGHRVVVRYRAGSTLAGRPLATDVFGELISLDGGQLVLQAESGGELILAVEDIVAARRVPPRPPRWSEMLELERVADRAWPAPEHESLGEWLLRAAQGWTNRANSALPLGDPGRPTGEAIAACEVWYTERGLRPRVTVPLPVRRDVADELVARGWVAQPPVLVQTASLAAVGSAAADSAVRVSPDFGVELAEEPSADFQQRLATWKHKLPAAAMAVLTGVRPVAFAEARRDGELVATGRGAVVDGWLHIGLVEVAPSARRLGLAHRVTGRLVAWAAGAGATRAVLQVEESNEAAVATYRGLGFTTHHRYITFGAPE